MSQPAFKAHSISGVPSSPVRSRKKKAHKGREVLYETVCSKSRIHQVVLVHSVVSCFAYVESKAKSQSNHDALFRSFAATFSFQGLVLFLINPPNY